LALPPLAGILARLARALGPVFGLTQPIVGLGSSPHHPEVHHHDHPWFAAPQQPWFPLELCLARDALGLSGGAGFGGLFGGGC
jgi:hypothetical protein